MVDNEILSSLNRKKSSIGHEFPQIVAIFASSLAGVTQGTLFSWTSPSIVELVSNNETGITLEEASYFTIISPISMIITGPIFSQLNDVIGRRAAVLSVAVPQIIAWVITLLANNIWYYYVARVVAGAADAALFATVPIYVCEVSQPRVRGTWGNMTAINIYFGILLINIIGSYCSIPMTAAICGCIPIVQFTLFWFMPESPYYLLMKKRESEARECLKKLGWSGNVEEELYTLKLDVQRQLSESGTMKDLFIVSSNLKALLICTLIRIAQQFSGLSAFETYTIYLFQQSGSTISEKTSAIVFSALILVCVASSAYFVERLGRRVTMVLSCFSSGIVLGILSVYFCFDQFTETNLAHFEWVPLAGMIIYVLVSSPGIGILPTLSLGELFSTSIKVKAVSVMNIVLAMCFIIVPKLFQTLTYNIGIFAPFAFFAFCCFAFTLLSYLFVIETKGKTLEKIQQELKGEGFVYCKKTNTNK